MRWSGQRTGDTAKPPCGEPRIADTVSPFGILHNSRSPVDDDSGDAPDHLYSPDCEDLPMTDEPLPPDNPIPSDLVREDPSFADIVLEFVNGLGDRVRRMEEAIAAGDLDELRDSAHQLKGNGGGYGYPDLTQRAAELERAARSGIRADCTERVAELKRLCQRLVVTTE